MSTIEFLTDQKKLRVLSIAFKNVTLVLKVIIIYYQWTEQHTADTPATLTALLYFLIEVL